MLVIKKIKNFLFIKNNNDLDYTKFKIIFIKLKKRKFLKPSLFLQKIDYANSHIYTTEKKLDELIKTIDNFQNQVIELNNKINELTLNKHK